MQLKARRPLAGIRNERNGTMATKEIVFETVRAKVSEVELDPANPRETLTGIKELASSIKSQGLLNPPVAIRVTGTKDSKGNEIHYRVKAGNRRFSAVQSLGWEYVEIRIAPSAQYVALAENLGRQDLSTFETAKEFARIQKETKDDLATIARNVGFSPKTAQMYVRCIKELNPKIAEQWQKRTPLATVPNLVDIISKNKNHAKQWDHWKILGGVDVGDGGVGGGDGGGGGNPQPTPPAKMGLKKMCKTLAEAFAAHRAIDEETSFGLDEMDELVKWMSNAGVGKKPRIIKVKMPEKEEAEG